MRRVLPGALFFAALLLLAHRPASATVEFCPATLTLRAVGNSSGAIPAESLYGFDLSASGPRKVSAHLAFDTSAGWFTAEVPAVTLVQEDRRYAGASVTFVTHEWASPVMYVRFPSGVTVSRGWVAGALSEGDSFGWEDEGSTGCLPPSETLKASATASESTFALQAKTLSAAPGASARVIAAQKSAPLERTDCAQPFRDASVTHAAQPDFELTNDIKAIGTGNVEVRAAIAADGHLADAWIWNSSGSPSFDAVVLQSARQSTYQGAVAYCQPVPAFYIFRVRFAPG